MPRPKVFTLKNRKQAPREKQFTDNTELQLALASVVRGFLSAFGVPREREQEVDFFFYAGTRSAAGQLATVLKEMHYDVSLYNPGGDDPRFLITGMTTKMRMDDRTLQLWTEKMCGLAERYGCQFDGWGTIVEME